MLTGKTISTWRTTWPNVTLSITNPTLTGLGLNLGPCGKRLQSNQLYEVRDIDLSGISVKGININPVSQYWNVLLPVITLPSVIWQNVAVENIESKKSHSWLWYMVSCCKSALMILMQRNAGYLCHSESVICSNTGRSRICQKEQPGGMYTVRYNYC